MDTADWSWQTAFLKTIDFLCNVDSVGIFMNTWQRFKLDLWPDISLIVLKTRLYHETYWVVIDFHCVVSVFINIDNHALSHTIKTYFRAECRVRVATEIENMKGTFTYFSTLWFHGSINNSAISNWLIEFLFFYNLLFFELSVNSLVS